jgi:hypothetical protein
MSLSTLAAFVYVIIFSLILIGLTLGGICGAVIGTAHIIQSLTRIEVILVKKIVKFHSRRAARDPNTTPRKLQAMSNSSDRLTRQAIACNPSTPPETLLLLLKDFPRQVVENPVFRLMLLENPRLLEEMNAYILAPLFNQDDIPEILFTGSANHSDYPVITAIAESRALSAIVLENIGIISSSPYMCEMVITHRLITPTILYRLAVRGQAVMKEAIAYRIQKVFEQGNVDTVLPNVEEIIAALIENGTDRVMTSIIGISELSDTLIDQLLAKMEQHEIRHYGEDIMYYLYSALPSKFVRRAAIKSDTSPAILQVLSGFNDRLIRRSVAGNPNTPFGN